MLFIYLRHYQALGKGRRPDEITGRWWSAAEPLLRVIFDYSPERATDFCRLNHKRQNAHHIECHTHQGIVYIFLGMFVSYDVLLDCGCIVQSFELMQGLLRMPHNLLATRNACILHPRILSIYYYLL